MKAHRRHRVPLCARALPFALLTVEEAQALAQATIKNGQTWAAAHCRTECIPELIRFQGANLNRETRRALQCKIEHHKWYPGEAPEVEPSQSLKKRGPAPDFQSAFSARLTQKLLPRPSSDRKSTGSGGRLSSNCPSPR